MTTNVLISSLGRSPGVVTGTVDALEAGNHGPVHQVITISTSDNIIQEGSVPLLRHEFKHYYSDRITYFDVAIASEDIREPADSLQFAELAAKHLNEYRKRGHNVFVSLAGGRKTMSATLALLAQLFGARLLCHLFVPASVERTGGLRYEHILEGRSIEALSRELTPALHPEQARLVILPFVSLFPLLDDILGALRGKMPARADLTQILRDSQLLDEQATPTAEGQMLLDLLDGIELLPSPTDQRPEEKEIAIPDHHGGELLRPWAEKLVRSPFIKAARSTEYRPHAHEPFHAESNGNILFTLTDTDPGYTLLLETTATSKAQAGRVIETLRSLL